jgi:CzcA family heavy metal efflux pump
VKLTSFSVHNHVTTLFLMVAVTVLGISAYVTLPRESNPDISIPIILVNTLYPGASPEDVEQQVTRILERELKGVDNLKELRSTSMESYSIVEVEFVSGVDLDVARQKVRDKVDLAKADFSSEVEEPLISEINFSDMPILQVHLSGAVGAVKLKEIAEDLEDFIEGVPGVLRATIIGGLEREVQVNLNPDRLRQYGVSVDDVILAIQKEHISIPGGDLKLGDSTYAVRLPGEVKDPRAIADFVVKAEDSKPIFIRDLGTVRYGFKERESYARIDRVESVALSIQKRTGANIIEVADAVKAIVDREKTQWPLGVEATMMADQSKDIRTMVKDLENNILSGVVLVVLVLMFALGFRQAVFVGAAIPFSMLLTFIAVQALGMTLNMIVLFSLVLALGMLVDNAIVVVENIYRHMEEGASRMDAAISATEEVGGAILVSTLTTLAAFFPLMFWPGIVGDFMSFLPKTVSIALAASLLVAFTFNPVLCSRFLSPEVKTGRFQSWLGKGGQFIERLYDQNLKWALNHRWTVLFLTLVAFVVVFFLFGRFNAGVEFFPQTEPRQIFVDLEMPPGTRVEKTNAVIHELEAKLENFTDLKVMSASAGTGSQTDFGGGGGGGASEGRIILDLYDREERKENSFHLMDQVRAITQIIPGAIFEVDRPEEGPPVGAPLTLEIRGEDFETLGKIASRVRETIRDIPNLVSLDDDFDKARPELTIHLDRTEAARLGLSTQQIASTVRTAVNGTEAAIFRKGEDEADITVRFSQDHRSDLSDLTSIFVFNNDTNEAIPISSFARFEKTASLTSIKHKDQKRVVTVTGDVTEPGFAQPVREEVAKRLAELTDLLPPGYTYSFAGQETEEKEAQAFLTKAFLYALFLVLALMVGKFNSLKVPLIIITSVVMSMVGVLLGLIITQLPFGIIMTGLGVISLAGIVVNNAIVLLDYGEQLRKRGLSRLDIVVTAGKRRMRPVLLTAITTLLGLIPLTTGVEFDFIDFQLKTGGESSQWWQSMGVAVMFGLAFATFLTLILVPVLYDFYLAGREKQGTLQD